MSITTVLSANVTIEKFNDMVKNRKTLIWNALDKNIQISNSRADDELE